MPAIVRSEFALALNQVATERGIDPSVVLESIKAAILAAYRKDYGTPTDELEGLVVELNPDNGEAHIKKDDKDITPPGFGRIAAQTANQVILQRIREAEKQAILTDFSAKVGNIVSGMVLRFDGPNVIVDIGRTQAVMPPNEQSPAERYRLNQRYTFYIEGIRETYRGNEIIVSRAHKGLVSGLFAREVPEVSQGAVEIREIAREAGSRTKVAVFSNQSGVDPVGSCVGQKGVRVQAVIGELGGDEKVDIIQWSDDSAQFISAALSPAKDISVELNQAAKTSTVTVPEDQLSLAIGREGQNVRLAAKLTGWRIDLKGKKIKVEEVEQIVTEKTAEVEKQAEAKPAEVVVEGAKTESESIPPVGSQTEPEPTVVPTVSETGTQEQKEAVSVSETGVVASAPVAAPVSPVTNVIDDSQAQIKTPATDKKPDENNTSA